MLHILNKAWANCLINQAEKNPDKIYLFVAVTEEENKISVELQMERGGVLPNVFVTTEKNMFEMMDRVKSGKGKMPMFDDILISHEVHDIFLKDFLGRHCKRKGA